jgi:hypothetical protein
MILMSSRTMNRLLSEAQSIFIFHIMKLSIHDQRREIFHGYLMKQLSISISNSIRVSLRI